MTTPTPAPEIRQRDADRSQETILIAAKEEFSEFGFAGGRIDRIAERAGMNKRLLNYYFGNKERLVEAMVEERFLPLVARAAAQLQQAGDDPLALVEAFIRDMVRNVTEQPWLSQLWVREILCEGGVLRERLMHRVAPMVPLLLAQKFAAAQARGALNPGLDPRLLVVSLIGLTLLPYAAAPIWRGVFANPQIGDDALINHTLALLKGGMEP